MRTRLGIAVLVLAGLAVGVLYRSAARERGPGGADPEIADRAPAHEEAETLEAAGIAPAPEASGTREVIAAGEGGARLSRATPAAGEVAIDVEVVSRDSGAPVAGIVLMLSSESVRPDEPIAQGDSPVGSTTTMPRTDADGRAVFLAPVGSEYTLYVLGGQGIETDFERFEAPASSAGERISIRFEVRTETDLVFFGKVVDDATEEPLAGATIERVVDGSLAGEAETAADGDGIFRVETRSWDPAMLRVDHEGYAWLVIQPTIGHATAAEAKLVRLARAATVVVRVTEAVGVPAADREVVVDTDARFTLAKDAAFRWWPGERPSWRETTGVDGIARVEGLPPNARLTLDLREDGRFLQRLANQILLEPGEERELAIQLGATCTIQGVAREVDGTPVEGLDLWLMVAAWPHPKKYFFEYESDDVVSRTRTGEAGTFRFDDVAPGDWWVGPAPSPAGSPGACAPVAELVTIAADEPRKDVVIETHRGLAISGRLLDVDGSEVAVGYVTAQEVGVGADVRKGRFVLGPLAPGDYELVGDTHSGANPFVMRSEPVVASTGDSDVVVRLREGGVLAGTARLPGGGAPDTASVTLVPADAKRSGFWMMGGAPRPGGSFEFRGVVPGVYHVLVRDEQGNAGYLSRVEVEAGQARRDLVVSMTPGASLKVVLNAPEGPRRFVRVYRDDMPIAATPVGATITVVPGPLTVVLCTFDPVAGEVVVAETRAVTAIAGEEVEVAFEVDD